MFSIAGDILNRLGGNISFLAACKPSLGVEVTFAGNSSLIDYEL